MVCTGRSVRRLLDGGGMLWTFSAGAAAAADTSAVVSASGVGTGGGDFFFCGVIYMRWEPSREFALTR